MDSPKETRNVLIIEFENIRSSLSFSVECCEACFWADIIIPQLAKSDNKKYMDNPWLKIPKPSALKYIPIKELMISPETPTNTCVAMDRIESLTNFLDKNSLMNKRFKVKRIRC